MKHTPVLILTLVAAAASAAPASGLNYNRASVGYVTSDSVKGYNVGATAELGHSGVLISGVYADIKGKGDLTGFSGYETGASLAYKFNVGPGDLAVGVSYLQGQFGAVNGFAVGEQTGVSLQYRQAINDLFEVTAGYQRVRTNLGALAVVGGYVSGAVASSNDNIFNVGVRYNITKELDLSLTYAFASNNAGGDAFGVSVGYSF